MCIIGFYYPGEILWPLSLAHGWKEERELAKTLVFSIYSRFFANRIYFPGVLEYICSMCQDIFVCMCWIYLFEYVGYISGGILSEVGRTVRLP